MTRRVNRAWQWLYAICRWVGVGVNVGASVCVCVQVVKEVVFSHQDLLCGNILYADGWDRVQFIDFEYGG